MGVIEIFRGMGKNFKVRGYTFYLFKCYKQIKCARSIYYTLLIGIAIAILDLLNVQKSNISLGLYLWTLNVYFTSLKVTG